MTFKNLPWLRPAPSIAKPGRGRIRQCAVLMPILAVLAAARVAQAQTETPVYNLPPEQRLPPEVIRALKDAADARRQHDRYERPDLRPEEAPQPAGTFQLEPVFRKTPAVTGKTLAVPLAAFASPPPALATAHEPEAETLAANPGKFLPTLLLTVLLAAGALLVVRMAGRTQE